MRMEHRRTEDKYHQLRLETRATAVEALLHPLKDHIKLKEIDSSALAIAKHWNYHPDRKVEWNWRKIYTEYSFRHPKRFEIAIWHSSLLCGLSIGKPTWAGEKLCLELIEASPEKTPLGGTIFSLTVQSAEAYALAIGATQVRIMNPINVYVRKYYESFGFNYSGNKSNYCARDIL